MKFKTKYSVGDIVKFYNHKKCDNDVGIINVVKFKYSNELLDTTSYIISPIKTYCDYKDKSIEIREGSVHIKLNKKTFEKEYTKFWAKEKMKSEPTK